MRYYEDMSWTYGRRRKPELSGCMVLWLAFLLAVIGITLALGMADMQKRAANGSAAGANAVTESQITTKND